MINLSNNQLTSDLPPHLFRDNKMLAEISLNENLISKLNADIFRGLHNLERIYLKGNKLETLPHGLFRDNRNLLHIDLESNRIIHVESEFSHLSKLTNLAMLGNVCVDKLFETSPSTLSEINNEIRTKCSNL